MWTVVVVCSYWWVKVASLGHRPMLTTCSSSMASPSTVVSYSSDSLQKITSLIYVCFLILFSSIIFMALEATATDMHCCLLQMLLFALISTSTFIQKKHLCLMECSTGTCWCHSAVGWLLCMCVCAHSTAKFRAANVIVLLWSSCCQVSVVCSLELFRLVNQDTLPKSIQ